METLKLKTKIGEHEFESEGPADIVQAHFHAFKEMIALSATKPKVEAALENAEQKTPHVPLAKIAKAEGRVVSLTARCETIEEAVLILMLGQKDFRNNQEVTGSEIMDGLKQSGYAISRVDRLMDKLSADGDLITTGLHRGRRYRLSNQGITKALGIAKEVVATVA